MEHPNITENIANSSNNCH